MLGVCYGKDGHSKKEQTYDVHRGNVTLIVDSFNVSWFDKC